MSKYTPHTQEEIKSMLASLNMTSLDELYADVPQNIACKNLDIASGLSQYEVSQQIKSYAKINKCYSTILRGAGIYDHIIPSVVGAIVNKEEFVTAYTPYQAEISQGVLQGIFEYQSLMCSLTGMEVSNASMYDGASAVAEAIIMCAEKKNKAIVLGQVNPEYKQVCSTYCYAHNKEIVFIEDKDGLADIDAIKNAIDINTACVVAQSPNYYGLIEDMELIGQLCKENNVKFIYVFNPIALALLPTPAECGADIAVGEGQQLGMNMYYGGAALGILTCSKTMMRRMPGRIVGQTVDGQGNRVFVLTLQAREQHIKRERATSSICSNQALNAFTALVYLSTIGKEGFKQLAKQCVNNAHYLANQIVNNGGKLKYSGEFFNEFVVNGGKDVVERLKCQDILGGLSLGQDTLWCATEKQTKQELDKASVAFLGGK
ncbi:MAG: aminomethyl-transferring glycine dehydrogenase subunit GcvPA [Clostridia bacterium]